MGRLGDAETFGTSWMTKETVSPDADSSVVGFVKWFDASKGFGFVVAENGGPDILLHSNVLRNFGQSSVSDQSRITILVQKTDRGLQATEVLSIAPPEVEVSECDPMVAAYDTAGLPLLPGRVKWFDKSKGFGFANAFGSDEDIFLHVEILRRCGLADLQAGEAISLKVVDGDRGQLAAEIRSWDHAAQDS